VSAHTPGPWHVEHGTPSGRRLVADLVEGGLRLTHYRIVHDGAQEGGGEADANLIAAAPDLLAALKALVDWQGVDHEATSGPFDDDVEECPGDDTCRCQIVALVNAAIAKAEGR
jgi:hypothetical protein